MTDLWPARPALNPRWPIVPIPHNNVQRHAIVQEALSDLEGLMKSDNTVSHLRGHIAARLEAYPDAQRYDRQGGRSEAELTPVERGASDRALAALSDLDHFLGVLSYAVAGIKGLKREFHIDPRVVAAPDPNRPALGMCQDHWAAGVFDVPAAEGRYRKRCRWCGEWFALWNQRCPAEVLRVYDEKGRRAVTSALLKQHAPYAADAVG